MMTLYSKLVCNLINNNFIYDKGIDFNSSLKYLDGTIKVGMVCMHSDKKGFNMNLNNTTAKFEVGT